MIFPTSKRETKRRERGAEDVCLKGRESKRRGRSGGWKLLTGSVSFFLNDPPQGALATSLNASSTLITVCLQGEPLSDDPSEPVQPVIKFPSGSMEINHQLDS